MSKIPDGPEGGIPISSSLEVAEPAIETARPVNKRVFYLSVQVVINAIIIGGVAKLLVALINLITNISFYGQFSFEEQGPAHHQLGLLVIVIPVIGAIIIGLMARLGSAAIRGHGIPEAMEQVLTNESRIKPIITLLKPLSAAISIGTGGPFGAEGPIISTGGAFGSFAGQLMHISPNERKIMLTAGATAGMAAIFGTPLAAVMLAIELLLFEFSPRSIIPVALACATGASMHFLLFGTEPVFAMPGIPEAGYQALCWYVLLGVLIGIIAAGISKSIYLIEDVFERLPIHWMWWPAIGAVAIGVVGYFAPYTLGVGYNNISELLSGTLPLQLVLGLCFLKFLSWSISLGSGTSGGTLAPLLTIGGATGVTLGMIVLAVFPHAPINLSTCALIGMAAMFAGASRALLTSIVFALETTMQPHGLLPLLGACTASYFISFFLMRGTIMTEKIHRRGVSTPDVYEPDVLQSVNVDMGMECAFDTVAAMATAGQVKAQWAMARTTPAALVLKGGDDAVAGILSVQQLYAAADDVALVSLVSTTKLYVYPKRTLGFAVALMHRYGLEHLPVVDEQQKDRVLGVLTPSSIFSAYSRYRQSGERYQRTISLSQRRKRLIVSSRHWLKT
ncbi:chloride channel protein [Chitinophaga pendula]|uniref:chloride channel protein n=1 Tax=Chitinophaga TaxID=79328 RepID=UPI000BAF3490|nr:MULTISPECIES: chloride channel protein [Chitinophaga]ASZ14091.1 chloride channel protein [Chitinophaga sp. MD30]UCJ08276.1 chloride channel protein [Chitinophaga pendula]